MGKPHETFAGSRPIGKFWPCSFNVTHHPQPVVLPIKKGPIRYFLPQCICGANGRAALMPQDWNDSMGLTEQQARTKGYMILAVIRPVAPTTNKR
jgi:hypothetical protein